MKEFLRDQRAGRTGGARLYTGEFGFSIEGGMQNANPSIHRPKTADEGRQMVRDMAANRPLDFVKLWVDGNPKMDLNIAGAVIEEAERQGLRSFVHLSTVEDARKLIEHGLDSMAHIPRDKDVDEAFIRLAKEKGVTQTTNLIGLYGGRIYVEPRYMAHPGMRVMFSDVIGTINTPEWLGQQTARLPNMEGYNRAVQNLLKMHAAGIPIVIGTDSGAVGQFPGVWEHLDLELLVRAGLSPIEGIKAATINGARLLGVADRYGSLEVGKIADFVVLNSDPVADIKNTLDISAVWMNGQEVNRAALAAR
jgi:imidazolonepropionase-like amidohydrolase